MRRMWGLLVPVLLGLVCVAGCKPRAPTPTAAAVYDLSNLVSDLQAKGATVTVSQQPVDYVLLTKGRRVAVDGAWVVVFEFVDGATADWVAGGISAERGSITITRLEDGSQVWNHGDCVGTPYLYKKGKLIVLLYDHAPVYDTARARRMVRSVLGSHFAGGQWAFLSSDGQ